MEENALLDIEILSVLADATEKTQKPFLKRALRFYKNVMEAEDGDPESYMKNILRKYVMDVLQMSDKVRATLLLDYFDEILPLINEEGEPIELDSDLEWNNKNFEFMLRTDGTYLRSDPERIVDTVLYQQVDHLKLDESLLGRLIVFIYMQLVSDVLTNRSQNEHIAPAINRLKAKKAEIDRIFLFDAKAKFWGKNFVVVDLADVNLDMKKTIPLLLAKKLYAEHKMGGPGRTLTMIIDEAHNILSTESFREAESWKDYRIETFEEIIKEGRKFGVFVTISSQRPNDISPTITSQAHNYFIHRLINQLDLNTIGSAVSYIDRVTEESIPTLPTGTCIFSGVASQMPLKINVKPLPELARPQSDTRKFSVVVPAAKKS